MTIETANFINQLNTSFPRGTDLLKEGDDHIRMIKNTLKATFPRVTGAVNISNDQLNGLDANVNATATGITFKLGSTYAAGQNINFGNNRLKGSGRPSTVAEVNAMQHDELLSWGHLRTLFRMLYPKDSLFITNGVNPATLPMFAGTSWARHWPGRYLISSTDNATIEPGNPWRVGNNAGGGSFNFTIQTVHMPVHSHYMAHSHHMDFMSGAMDRYSAHSHSGVPARAPVNLGGNSGAKYRPYDDGRTDETDINHLHHIVGDTLGVQGGPNSDRTDNQGGGASLSYEPACSGVSLWIRTDNNGVGV